MEAYETPVMEVVEIEKELLTVDCPETNGGASGFDIDRIRPVNKESL